MQWPDGRLEVLESAFPGEIVGLGNLETHVSSANALSDTMVSIVDESEFAREVHSDGVLSLRFAAAAEREFDYLRERAKHAPKRPPVALVANYLLVVASMNERQNKAADFISDEYCNQIIVEMLQLDMNTMSHSLLLLQRLGLIAAAPGGLRLLNVSSMEFLADVV